MFNLNRGRDSSLAILHRSNCSHISGYTLDWEEGAFTKRQYIKVCALEEVELVEWLAVNRPKALPKYKACMDCHPPREETLKGVNFPEEVGGSPNNYSEGSAKTLTINAYERDPKARAECLKIYGYNCSACEMNFEEVYGDIGKEYIHVHHLRPLSTIGKAYQVNPKEDLRPVCPNCHAMLHRKEPPFSIEEMKIILKQNRKS